MPRAGAAPRGRADDDEQSRALKPRAGIRAAPAPAAARRPAIGGRPRPARTGGDDVIKTVRREEPKVGRNDPCPCGSGKKYKKCHGAAA